MAQIRSRQELYSHFDEYTFLRKEELNQRNIKRGIGLLKTYAIETSATAKEEEIPDIFKRIGWDIEEIDTRLYQARMGTPEVTGYIDVLSPRYLCFHTTTKSEMSDTTVKRAVRSSVELDHVWLSSPILHLIWRELISNTSRFATLRFENQPLFELLYKNPMIDEAPDDDFAIAETQDDYLDDELPERQIARLEIKERINKLHAIMNSGVSQSLEGIMNNLTRIKAPSSNEQGRYEYFQYGKFTNRGNEFRGYAEHIRFLIEDVYGRATEIIEQITAYALESHSAKNGSESFQIRGAISSFRFHEKLSIGVFERFIQLTFEKGKGPFRLWGNPIRLKGPKYHVYGIDLHLWQPIYLDMSPDRFLVVLPKGTCGNTIHRLTANIQRYLDPLVTVSIGDTDYTTVIQDALRSTLQQ